MNEAKSTIRIGDKVRLNAKARALGVRLTNTDTQNCPATGTVVEFLSENICRVRTDGPRETNQYPIIDFLEKVPSGKEL